MKYSKTPHSIRFDDCIIEMFQEYQNHLYRNQRKEMTFSEFVRIAVQKSLRDKFKSVEQ
jgi:hypothetical protein